MDKLSINQGPNGIPGPNGYGYGDIKTLPELTVVNIKFEKFTIIAGNSDIYFLRDNNGKIVTGSKSNYKLISEVRNDKIEWILK